MTSVNIPTAFRSHTAGQRKIHIGAVDVGSLLNELTTKHPALREHLFDGDALLSFVNIFVNDQNIRDLDGMATTLSDRDDVFLVPAMAGG